MLRKLLYSRVPIIFVTTLMLLSVSSNFISHETSIAQQSSSTPRDTNYLNFEEALFNLTLASENITRGEDDLILYFTFSYDNLTYIPDSTIYYNISNPFEEFVFGRELIVNTSDTFNETVIWSTFNGQDAGEYLVTAIANSTTTDVYIETRTFQLYILPDGKVKMYFSSNPAILERNQNNDVECIITNTGGSTITNVTITNEIHKTGTEGSISRSIKIPELTLVEGQVVKGNISFFPETYLYQKHSFAITYQIIDKPDTSLAYLSDPLEIIVMPNITIDQYTIPVNATIDETYRLTYSLNNYEGVSLFIRPYAKTQNDSYVSFDLSDDESIEVTAGYHFFSIEGDPLIEGTQFLFFRIELEWITVSETKWYCDLMSTVITFITIHPSNYESDFFNPVVVYSLIFSAIGVGILYFSRDMFRNVAKRVKKSSERTFPELTYPLDRVILDGSNIAWEEKSTVDKPKISNIENMINRLSRANFTRIITVADAALRYQIDNQKRLDKLVKEGAMKMLPARVDGDKFILRLAEEEGAMIVSNDMFKEFRDMKDWIDQRRIPYTILDGEVYLHPTAVQPVEGVEEGEEIAH